jgi:1-phosphofructokinase
MVITVTLNPAMDKTITVDNFTLGAVNRVSSIRLDVGGKGINVSKVLKNFEVSSVCTGFLGGVWESTIENELVSRGIGSAFVHIEGSTRTNTKVVDTVNKVFTDINEAGPNIDADNLESFLKSYESLCSQEDIVVLAGGVSPSVPVDIYATLIRIAKEKGAKVILDADGELLKRGLEEKPDIIKPNEHELSKLFNINKDSLDEIIGAAQKLRESGISKVLVSLGEHGSLFITDTGIYQAKGYKVPVKSTVGAGDSMVAALVYSLLNNLDDEATLKFANACGAASVTLEGTEACTLEQVNNLLNTTK